MNGLLLDHTVSFLLVRARRYRSLAAASHDRETAQEFEHLASLFEAHASRGFSQPVRLH
jgi:hypothetical protein